MFQGYQNLDRADSPVLRHGWTEQRRGGRAETAQESNRLNLGESLCKVLTRKSQGFRKAFERL